MHATAIHGFHLAENNDEQKAVMDVNNNHRQSQTIYSNGVSYTIVGFLYTQISIFNILYIHSGVDYILHYIEYNVAYMYLAISWYGTCFVYIIKAHLATVCLK